jgi:ubiquinone/menaquinone biosynthesis C-methylase UbiE
MTGVDLSPAMLAFAEAAEAQETLGITYIRDDAQQLGALADASFDGATSFLALTDIPDLDAVLGSVRRALCPDGWLVLAVTHPCFEAPHARWQTGSTGETTRVVSHYFDEGFWRSSNPAGIRGRVGAYHRTLATYLNTLTGLGFAVERVEEPRYAGAAVAHIPGYAVVPTVLLVRARSVGPQDMRRLSAPYADGEAPGDLAHDNELSSQ